MSPVKPIPDNYPRVTPYLYVDGAADAIAFYTKVFGATERMRMGAPMEKSGTPSFRSGTPSSCSRTSSPTWARNHRARSVGRR